jgi:hypothetical protein
MAVPISANAIPSGSALTRVAFRRGVTHMAERQWIMRDLVGSGDLDVIQLQEELTKERGDTIRMKFSPTRDQAGFGSNDTITGNEPTVDFFYDDMKINYYALAFALKDPMVQQRVDIPLKATAMAKLPILWKRYFERCVMWQMTGFTPANTDAGLAAAGFPALSAGGTEYRMGGMNQIIAYDAAHTYFAKDKADAAAVAADSTCKMSLGFIDEMEHRAASQDYLDYPILPGPSGYYYLVLSTDGRKQLRQNTSPGDWQDITRARLEGGEKYQNNPIYGAFLGRYSKTIITVSDYVPKAVQPADSAAPQANTKSFIFLGAKSGCVAYGQGYNGQDHLDWSEQITDHKNFSVAVDTVWGFKRTTFPNLSGTSETYGSLLGVHYSAIA